MAITAFQSPGFTWTVRILEIILSIIILGLTANTINYTGGEGSITWSLVVSLISLIYLGVIFLLSYLKPTFLNIGAIFVVESLLVIFYFTAFIATAAIYGPGSCHISFYDYYSSVYYNYSSSWCRTAKATIAFTAFNFILFLLTSIAFFFNSFFPLRARTSAQSSFLFTNETELDKPVLNLLGIVEEKSSKKEIDLEQTIGSDLTTSNGIENPTVDPEFEATNVQTNTTPNADATINTDKQTPVPSSVSKNENVYQIK
ncbi:hypothetical protein WICMUC_003487 [Wickerhamomyces mucosus]|uniref:MARVEL domain-containing protein n=1 Tax=Wickerhamomyces mucosus TaxID=1378264 RepID=A0A9P8TCJ2_9ASCO|nr:hypothetical protein WICMUC_003487 [Wickerhamomyces mucosus]